MTLPVHPYRTSTLRRVRRYRLPIERVAFTVAALVVSMALVLLGYARSLRRETCWRS